MIFKLSEKQGSLQKKVETNGFLNENDEIVFFKKTKQVPLTNLIYYSELQRIELELGLCSGPKRKKLLKRSMKNCLREIKKHNAFNNYLRLGYTHFDKFYFVRSAKNHFPVHFVNPMSSDSLFDTSHDYLMAKLIALKKLVIYLKKELNKKMDLTTNLEWTSSKSSLIELIYALHQTKAINGGNCDIKEISSSFENQFSIKLGDVYGTFNEIKSRKSGRTKFIDKLSFNLSKKINDDLSY